ncbi:MAG TPA: hypothetical protein VF597_04045 [Candidatus Saccharimonadales bacterium]|jgi:hypothetical protein
MTRQDKQAGAVNPLLIASILLGLLAAALGGVSVYAYTNYLDQKNNTDAKIGEAVTTAKIEQSKQLEAEFTEREKQPYVKFNGPSDLGSVSFDYPKTWSVYVAKNGSTGDYESYLNPGVVPTVANDQPFAVRVDINSKAYEATLKTYEALVKKGTLKSNPITVNGFTGVRLDGEFTKQRKGSSVIFKVRDKTLLISSDADAFKNDFNDIILKSLDFNP